MTGGVHYSSGMERPRWERGQSRIMLGKRRKWSLGRQVALVAVDETIDVQETSQL